MVRILFLQNVLLHVVVSIVKLILDWLVERSLRLEGLYLRLSSIRLRVFRGYLWMAIVSALNLILSWLNS